MIAAHTYRSVFGLWTTGVGIVTGRDRGGRPFGLTVGSLSSVSIDPPLLSFCLRNGSTTWTALRETGRFCVNILAHDQGALAHRFASGDPAQRFESLEDQASLHGSPRIAGCCAWIDAAIHREIAAGDHGIVIGAITSLAAEPGRIPLAFARGRLGRVEDLAELPEDHLDGWQAAWTAICAPPAERPLARDQGCNPRSDR